MQGAEHHVAGFRRTEPGADGVFVAHFAHEDQVGVFAQRPAQGVGEGVGVASHHALRDDAHLVFIHELDRVFHRDDVRFAGLVDLVHQRGEGGGFSGAGNATHEIEATVPTHNFPNHGGHVEFIEGDGLLGDKAYGEGHGTGLDVTGTAQVAQASRVVLEGGLALGLEDVEFLLAAQVEDDLPHVFRRDDGHVDRDEVVVHADVRLVARAQVDVRCAPVLHQLDNFVDVEVAVEEGIDVQLPRARTHTLGRVGFDDVVHRL